MNSSGGNPNELERQHSPKLAEAEEPLPGSIKRGRALGKIFESTSRFVNHGDVVNMINLQVSAIDRLENTNSSLNNCIQISQARLDTTISSFSKTTKQLKESKKDLDYIHKKIVQMKSKLKEERPTQDTSRTASIKDEEEESE